MIAGIKQVTKDVGLDINLEKTKFMTNLATNSNIDIDGSGINQVYEYTYLGHELR